jgi:hypothetical protein
MLSKYIGNIYRHKSTGSLHLIVTGDLPDNTRIHQIVLYGGVHFNKTLRSKSAFRKLAWSNDSIIKYIENDCDKVCSLFDMMPEISKEIERIEKTKKGTIT